MKILSEYQDGTIKTTPEILTERIEKTIYPMSDKLINNITDKITNKNTVILFSGSWRFHFDATYIEHKGFELATSTFHPTTIFVDPNTALFDYILGKLKPEIIAVLHSGTFLKYRKISDIMLDLQKFKKYLQPGGQVIATMPITRINFNRLTTSIEQLTKELLAEHINENLIVTL